MTLCAPSVALRAIAVVTPLMILGHVITIPVGQGRRHSVWLGFGLIILAC